jgi:putative transposase
VLLRLAYLTVTNTFAVLRLLPMSDRDKDVEILALRHQITVLERQLSGTRVQFTAPDRAFTRVFDEVFFSLGARVIRTPVRAPRANAIAERWVGTVRRECTGRLLIYNEHHLRRVLTAYERHYNTHRPHRARDRRPPQPLPAAPADLDHVRLMRRRAVDGLISEYRNAA